jgi:hypothetical protein
MSQGTQRPLQCTRIKRDDSAPFAPFAKPLLFVSIVTATVVDLNHLMMAQNMV